MVKELPNSYEIFKKILKTKNIAENLKKTRVPGIRYSGEIDISEKEIIKEVSKELMDYPIRDLVEIMGENVEFSEEFQYIRDFPFKNMFAKYCAEYVIDIEGSNPQLKKAKEKADEIIGLLKRLR